MGNGDVRDIAHITKLTVDGDFQMWKYEMQILFEAKDFLKVVNGSETLVTATTAKLHMEWEKKNAGAKLCICTAVDQKVKKRLLTCKTANDMCIKLNALHMQMSAENKHILLQDFYHCRFKERDDIATHISMIEAMASHLNGMQEKISDSAVMTKIICTLPAEYKHIFSAWDNVPEAERMVEKLQTRLLKKEKLLNSAEGSTQA